MGDCRVGGPGAISVHAVSARRGVYRKFEGGDALDIHEDDIERVMCFAKPLDWAHSSVGKTVSGERQLNVLECCEYANALRADAVDITRSAMK
jgi:hypothetical protein